MKVSDVFRFLEKKDHLIDRLDLTPDQKQELKAFFTKHPSYEGKIDWNNKSLQYKDFASLLELDGKSKTQAKKNGLSGLVEEKDYVDFGEVDIENLGRCHLYQPLSYLGSMTLASNRVPPIKGNGAKWCIAYQKDDKYWYKYSGKGIKFLFVFTKDTKYALTIYPESLHCKNEVYTFEDTNIHWPDWCKSPIIQNCIVNFKDVLGPSLDELLNRYKGTLVKNSDGTIDNINGEPVNLSAFMHNGRFICRFNRWEGTFYADHLGLTSLIGGPKEVDGSYYCNGNYLTTLEGAPTTVSFCFHCDGNQLISLEGGPSFVGKDYVCMYNQLTSLKGCPKTIKGNFNCSNNKLTSLEFGPTSVGLGFDCSYNELTSLEYGPDEVGKSYIVSDNKLTSLNGAPKKILLDFNCSRNMLKTLNGGPMFVNRNYYCNSNVLESLTGAAEYVSNDFMCYNNKLKSFVGAPKRVCGTFYCTKNPIESVYGLPEKVDHIVCDRQLIEAIRQKGYNNVEGD